MKSALFLPFALVVSAAHALVMTGGATLVAPFNNTDVSGVTVTGGLTLRPTGESFTFAARNWAVSGGLYLPIAGNYIINGNIIQSGGIFGPSLGTATIQFTGSRTLTGITASNVRVIQPGEQLPSAVAPAVTIPMPRVGAAAAAPLVNISTRATLAAGQSVTPGFVVGGTLSRRVLIRAVGPTLTMFGVANPISNPTMAIFSGSNEIARNDDWGGSADMSALFSAIGAFGLPATSRDAAVVLTLLPGNYTVQARGVALDDFGEVVVEVYFVD